LIVDSERGISFEIERLFLEDYYPPPSNVSFEEAAKIAARAIYERFGICIDGMVGYMFVLSSIFSGHIVCAELTSHSWGAELFHFLIDSETGAVGTLVMNTPETPFIG